VPKKECANPGSRKPAKAEFMSRGRLLLLSDEGTDGAIFVLTACYGALFLQPLHNWHAKMSTRAVNKIQPDANIIHY